MLTKDKASRIGYQTMHSQVSLPQCSLVATYFYLSYYIPPWSLIIITPPSSSFSSNFLQILYSLPYLDPGCHSLLVLKEEFVWSFLSFFDLDLLFLTVVLKFEATLQIDCNYPSYIYQPSCCALYFPPMKLWIAYSVCGLHVDISRPVKSRYLHNVINNSQPQPFIFFSWSAQSNQTLKLCQYQWTFQPVTPRCSYHVIYEEPIISGFSLTQLDVCDLHASAVGAILPQFTAWIRFCLHFQYTSGLRPIRKVHLKLVIWFDQSGPFPAEAIHLSASTGYKPRDW